MRKAKVKLITALSLTVVMLAAMTGIAVVNAESVRPFDPEVYNYNIPNDGTEIQITLRIGNFISGWTAGQTHTISATTSWAGSGGSTGDLQYRFKNETGAEISNWLNSGTPFQWTDNSDPDYVTLYVRTNTTLSIPVDAQYTMAISDVWSGDGGRIDMGACTVFATAIPEFSTRAIPMAIAILGGLFFLNHRKRREE